MSPRKSNMLEAFRASDSLSADPAARSVGVKADAPRPLVKPAGLGPTPFDSASSVWAPSVWASADWVARAPIFLIATLVGLGLLGGAYWLGKLSVGAAPGGESASGEVWAAGEVDRWDYPDPGSGSAPEGVREAGSDRGEPSSATGASSPAPEPSELPDELDANGRTADDRSFYDKSNRFTVRAIYYGNTPKGRRRALTTYRYLRGLGLPTIAPIDQGDIIVLCIGAEPRREGRLAELSDRLRAFPGPPPRSEAGAFAGAYFVNIDDVVERP